MPAPPLPVLRLPGLGCDAELFGHQAAALGALLAHWLAGLRQSQALSA